MRELSLNILDIVQNSISAGANLIEVDLDEDFNSKITVIKITDNGSGMTKEQIDSVTNPFYTTRKTRKVGLGIPFFKMAAEVTGGNFKIESSLGSGTTITAKFINSNIDMTPVGDINSTISILIKCSSNLDFVFKRTINGNSFTLDTREIRNILGIEDNEKDVVISFVRKDKVEELKSLLEVFFISSKRNAGISFSIELDSIIGVKVYQFLADTVREAK